jgi:hypothetical protein
VKISIKDTKKHAEILKAMSSDNANVAHKAQAAVAKFMSPVLAGVINNSPSLSSLFTNLEFKHEDNKSIPLDLYHDNTDEDYITIWNQNQAGGLPTNTAQPKQSELKITTYTIDSAVEFDKKYAKTSRLDVLSKSMTRLAQEILLKKDRTSANLILGSLAKAKTSNKSHTLKSLTSGALGLADFNNLLTHSKRIHASWSGGTPASQQRGITDIICSPEVVSGLRSLAFNPVYKGSSQSDSTSYPATDEMRSEFYNAAGVPDIYGISIMELNEMGVSQRYNQVFDAIQGRDSRFNGGQDEVIIGIDRSSKSLIRAVSLDEENESELKILADDQYNARQSKIGFYCSIEEGRVILDDRALTGIVICGGAVSPTQWNGECGNAILGDQFQICPPASPSSTRDS